MYVAWLEDESLEDGELWDAPTAEDAADMHVDSCVIPAWGDLGSPLKVTVLVKDHTDTITVFEYDIDLVPVRGSGRLKDLQDK